MKALIAEAEQEFGERGRLVIRKSGTEPLIRVMAECEDAKLLEETVDMVVAAVQHAAG